eukprot:gene15257-biopygen12713
MPECVSLPISRPGTCGTGQICLWNTAVVRPSLRGACRTSTPPHRSPATKVTFPSKKHLPIRRPPPPSSSPLAVDGTDDPAARQTACGCRLQGPPLSSTGGNRRALSGREGCLGRLNGRRCPGTYIGSSGAGVGTEVATPLVSGSLLTDEQRTGDKPALENGGVEPEVPEMPGMRQMLEMPEMPEVPEMLEMPERKVSDTSLDEIP